MRIIEYRAFWDTEKFFGGVELRLEDGSEVTQRTDSAGTLIVWMDILKNDHPVWYAKGSDQGVLVAGWEPVDQLGNLPERYFSSNHHDEGN